MAADLLRPDLVDLAYTMGWIHDVSRPPGTDRRRAASPALPSRQKPADTIAVVISAAANLPTRSKAAGYMGFRARRDTPSGLVARLRRSNQCSVDR